MYSLLYLINLILSEIKMILVYRYTEHSTVGLAQQWDQLDQLAMRMRHNLEQQIQARKRTGVPEEKLREFANNFRYCFNFLYANHRCLYP